jgi:hypothetical protein
MSFPYLCVVLFYTLMEFSPKCLRLSQFEIAFPSELPWVNSGADIAMFPLWDKKINIGHLWRQEKWKGCSWVGGCTAREWHSPLPRIHLQEDHAMWRVLASAEGWVPIFFQHFLRIDFIRMAYKAYWFLCLNTVVFAVGFNAAWRQIFSKTNIKIFLIYAKIHSFKISSILPYFKRTGQHFFS